MRLPLVRSILNILPLLLFAAIAPDARGEVMVWRVERPGVAPSHLVAAAEARDESAPIPAKVQKLLADARTLVVEMDLDPAALLPALPAALEGNPNRNGNAVDPALYRRALTLLRARGITGEQVSHLRPWALGLAVSAPPGGNDPWEIRLLRQASGQRKNLRSLESLAESVADLDTLGKKEQEQMIRAGLARGHKAPVMLEELLKAWRARDGDRIQQLLHAARHRLEPYRSDAHQKRLAGRLATLLNQGGTLVVTGPAGVDPRSGLIRHLRDRGWSATRVSAGQP